MPKWPRSLWILLGLLVALSFAEAPISSASSTPADKAHADKARDESSPASIGQVAIAGVAFLFMMALIVVAVVVIIALWWLLLLLLIVVSFAMLARSAHVPSMTAIPMPTSIIPVPPVTIGSTTKIPELVNATLDWAGAPAELRTIIVDWVQGVPVWLIWTLLCSCFLLVLVWRIGHYLALDKVGRDFKKYFVKPWIQANETLLLQLITTVMIFCIGMSFVTVIYMLELSKTGWATFIVTGVAFIFTIGLVAVWTVLTPWFTYAGHQMHEERQARRQRKRGNNGQAPDPVAVAPAVAPNAAAADPIPVAAVAAAPPK